MRKIFVITSSILILLNIISIFVFPYFLFSLILIIPLIIIGIRDMLQTTQTLKRNFPVIAHFRYMFEVIRPEIQQYFIESDTDGVPFNREQRTVVYQRAKGVRDSVPFGTRKNVYQVGYEWVNHSLRPTQMSPNNLRVLIGNSDCLQPYSANLLNISAMSYGSLSKNAIMALNGGAKDGGFAHNTGEGGLTPHHLANGGDIIWQIGTGYFGCRNKDGSFNELEFVKKAAHTPQVKMIEIKLSQGAKPGHGGILPARKVTPEIAEIRGVPLGKDVLSPPAHTAFSTPTEMMYFIAKLRKLSGGKPVGLKLCLGNKWEFVALCKAMKLTNMMPDYISIDGAEGGTGAAPLEFTNSVGTPGIDALIFVHNCLVGFGLRKKIRIMSSGKVTTGFEMIKLIALGADLVYSARGMMLALGCIQALKCNANDCPTGIATQDPELMNGLVIKEKRKRVTHFHHETIKSMVEIIDAMGLEGTHELRPWHVMRRVSETESKSYAEIFEYIPEGSLLSNDIPASFETAVKLASAETFRPLFI
ncbi:FMN-binding glutamate synthase family protein [Silvanigrella paludirubra]|uniref:FMN-binding glutamate synthase family protein n=1 Tax=Silvanigrella paludirubra TaxID=2499159 RepID=A0A6N6VYA2_9BACT|nr:FMN-binding glutamate synthase family protein [Silvanigrella paludirubra]KAB8041059.1 FMN-binding glutamate synthase family protein [Silvanigrella paludirubra]